MAEPWTDVLDYSCSWASGNSTSGSALTDLATELYTNSGVVYDGMQSHYDYGDTCTFQLTDFLAQWHEADCQDCAMFLSILSSSIGASLTQTRRIQGAFYTKDIKPIGEDDFGTPGWQETTWNFHQIAWYSNVYDGCIRLVPPCPRIPINENINSPYKADLYVSGTWDPLSPFRLTETDPYWEVDSEIH